MLLIYMMTAQDLRDRDACVEALLGRMALGDANAMGELYALIQTDVYAYALSKTASKEDAEDMAQDTFVQIYRFASHYRPMGKPMAWIFTVERNLILKHYHATQKALSLDETLSMEPQEADFTESVINNELLRRLLQHLNEEEREIISLHIVSGLKHREIAHLLQKPLSTVLSKYNRAIKKMQILVKEET